MTFRLNNHLSNLSKTTVMRNVRLPVPGLFIRQFYAGSRCPFWLYRRILKRKAKSFSVHIRLMPIVSPKRLIDILGAVVGLLLAAPIMLLIAVSIRLTMGSPLLFRQVRPGLHGQPFTLVKFRTMLDARDSHGSPLPDDQRLTRLGRFLRSTSLDELPELFNVLKGDMSLVGPRPLLMQYLERYTPEQARRHAVKPGLTGWAQISGRNALSWEDKFKLDVWYVDHQSLWLDARIIALTIWKVLKREGISQEGQATMGEFMGTISLTEIER
jgi:sugar transferase EpsL